MLDIVVEDGDIFGDGVNIAARLEGLAEPGGICVSARVQEDAAGKLDLAFEDIGEPELKNIARPVRVFRVRSGCPHPNPPPRAGEGSAPGARVGAAEPPPLPLPDKPRTGCALCARRLRAQIRQPHLRKAGWQG